MKRFFLILIVSIFFLHGVAQKNKALPGYFITNSNDTIQCAFKSRNWKKQPREIMVSFNGKDSLITPKNISGFSVPGSGIEYKSKLISPVLYELNMQFANSNYQPYYDSSRLVFIKELYQGNLSLYLYVDPVERKHFFIELGDEVTEIYKHLYTASGGFHYTDPIVAWYNQYIYVLKTFMRDCKSLFSIIDVIELKEEHLITLFKNYDACRKERGLE